jgi:uncharacterized membrane protein YozB (DUF420 family)
MTAPPTARRQWLIPTGLLLLAFVPVLAGSLRIAQLAGDGPVTPDNARFVAMPVPVIVHIVGASVYCVLGAFQFVPGFRRRRPGWHRVAGRVLVPCGLAAALAGLWMAVYYDLPAVDGELVLVFRLVFGSVMVASLVLGAVAVLRRDFDRHRAWMIRAYAIAQGAGSQAVTNLPWLLLVGAPREFPRAMFMLAGWVINLAVAEWIIRRQHRTARPSRSALVGVEA